MYLKSLQSLFFEKEESTNIRAGKAHEFLEEKITRRNPSDKFNSLLHLFTKYGLLHANFVQPKPLGNAALTALSNHIGLMRKYVAYKRRLF